MTTCACERVSPSKSHYYGELETLEAMQKFRRFYEDKMKEIDGDGGGDCLELKLKLQEKWINDLTEQTEMMARIVKELEDEATSRVQMLEERLRQTSKTAYEKVFYLENDLKNLIEFIRRKRNGGSWCIDGLQFYEVSLDDLFGLSKDGTCSDPVCNGSSENKKVAKCNKSLRMILEVIENPAIKGNKTKKRTSPSKPCRSAGSQPCKSCCPCQHCNRKMYKK